MHYKPYKILLYCSMRYKTCMSKSIPTLANDLNIFRDLKPVMAWYWMDAIVYLWFVLHGL